MKISDMLLQALFKSNVRSNNTGMILTFLTGSMALRFTATGAPRAARRIRILPMNQHA
jgi:hypothetical protein